MYFRVEKTKTFSGSEEEPPREKSLKKIQIEIVRNIKAGHRSNSPVRRSLKSYDTLTLPRRQGKYLCEPFVFLPKIFVIQVKVQLKAGVLVREKTHETFIVFNLFSTD